MSNISIKRVAITGVIGGLLAGAVKMGWEGLVPPRTPERDEEPPPVTMMKVFNVPDKIRHASYVYNDNEVPLAVMGIHYGFSVTNATLYALLSEQSESVTAWKGGLFGIGVHVLFHEFVLPKLKLTPERDELPPEEHFSELLGHMVWMYTIDLVRKSVK